MRRLKRTLNAKAGWILFAAWILAGFTVLTLGPGCGPIDIDQELIQCLATCDGECAWDGDDDSGNWRCYSDRELCEDRCAPHGCQDREGDGTWECDFPCSFEPENDPNCQDPDPGPEPEPEPDPEPEPEPVPEPPVGFLPPTAAELEARGDRVEVKPVKEGRRGFGATPRAAFGRDYYCSAEVAWPEACAAGRSFGPVAPDGHPKRVAWEAHFLGTETGCAIFSQESDDLITFDPWISLQGVNQNHPRNVRVCGQGQFETHPSWVHTFYPPEGRSYITGGEWSWATAHGEGRVCAEAADGVGRFCINYEEQ